MGTRNPSDNESVVLETRQVGWMQLHSKIVTDDATRLSVTTQNFANRNIGEDAIAVPYGPNGLLITFFGIISNQVSAFTWTLYGYREPHGPAQKIAYGTGFLGDVAVVEHPVTGAVVTAYYADELTITAQYWQQIVAIKDIAGASGEIATISFDGMGISHLRLELTDCNAGSADETDELEAVITGY